MANNIDLADFLKKQGEMLEKSGKESRWMRNTSVTIKGNRWFQHKYQEGGYPIQFLQRFYHYSFPQAVELLLNESGTPYEQAHDEEQIIKEFHAPLPNQTMKRIYGYLLKERQIDSKVLNVFVENKLIYESEQYHNVVFVGYDEQGIIRHAHKRATFGSYRGNEAGSDPKYSFHWNGNSNKIYVFEAPIDMLSYISLHTDHWQDHSYVALNGVSIQPLLYQLEKHHYMTEVILCLDHDIAGSEAMSRIQEELEEKEYGRLTIQQSYAKQKDWNEDLKEIKGVQEIKKGIDNPKPIMFHHLLKKYADQIQPSQKEIEIKAIMDQYLSLFTILNNKEQCFHEVRSHLCGFTKKALGYYWQLCDISIDAEEILIKQYRSHKDRGDLKKRIEQLKESVHKLKESYVQKENPKRIERLRKRLLDAADNGMMLLAYLDMQKDLEQYVQEELEMTTNRKPKCPLIGIDGNVFALIGMTQKSLKAIGEDEQAKEMYQRVTSSGSYQEALGIMAEYVDVTSIDEFNEQVFMELERFKYEMEETGQPGWKEMSIDIMTSENTQEALQKILDYRAELLPNMKISLNQ